MLASGRCQYHPTRPGLGICVDCRKVICGECTTQFDGINRCAYCLATRLARAAAVPPRREWTLGNVLLALLGLGAVTATIQLFTWQGG